MSIASYFISFFYFPWSFLMFVFFPLSFLLLCFSPCVVGARSFCYLCKCRAPGAKASDQFLSELSLGPSLSLRLVLSSRRRVQTDEEQVGARSVRNGLQKRFRHVLVDNSFSLFSNVYFRPAVRPAFLKRAIQLFFKTTIF